jgi:short-subunit dehydrogenase
MRLERARVLLTGAAGGIGSRIARELGSAGAYTLLTDLHSEALRECTSALTSHGWQADAIAADITKESGRAELVERARSERIDVLINAAGINPFGILDEQTEREVRLAIEVNTLAPILLCRQMIPVLKCAQSAHIVNVGSTFGSIGFPGFTIYSASKFAIRGFSEALRRELATSRIAVHYVAPRATRTRLSTQQIRAMNEELGIGSDSPDTVARAVVGVLRRGKREYLMGLPERAFAKINALFPGIVDSAVRRQLPVVLRYASRSPDEPRRAAATLSTSQDTLEIHR